MCNGEDLFGPTGKFPDGKLDDSDEGELEIGITLKDGRVIIAFGKSVSWIGLDAGSAQHLVDILKEKIKVMKG